MKREKNFYYFLTMIIFIICFTTSIILACRTIKVGKLAVGASILFYPMTYFIATLFAERYGKEKTFMMFNYAVFALIFMAIMLTITSCIPIYGAYDGLDKIFNIDFKLIFASILAFYASQFLNLKIYYYLEGYKGFKFLISGVIAITIDSFLFIMLSNIGVLSLGDSFVKFINQFIMGIVMVIFYTLCFTYLVDSVIKSNKKELELEIEKPKINKNTSKKSTTKKETKKSILFILMPYNPSVYGELEVPSPLFIKTFDFRYKTGLTKADSCSITHFFTGLPYLLVIQ